MLIYSVQTENVLSLSYHVVVIKTIKNISTHVVFFITVLMTGRCDEWRWSALTLSRHEQKNFDTKNQSLIEFTKLLFFLAKSHCENAHIFFDIEKFSISKVIRLFQHIESTFQGKRKTCIHSEASMRRKKKKRQQQRENFTNRRGCSWNSFDLD